MDKKYINLLQSELNQRFKKKRKTAKKTAKTLDHLGIKPKKGAKSENSTH